MSTKTRLLLSALTDGRPRPLLFVPLDVSEEVMVDAAREIARDYPSVTVTPVTADFTEPFGELPGEPGRRLVAFLGGTIGNFTPAERADFLTRVRTALAPGDHFLLGADLIKDSSRLIAAYDDAAGVTAAFNRNLIEVLRAELDAEGLYADDFEHVARWNPQRAPRWRCGCVPAATSTPASARSTATGRCAAGDEVRTEVSTKFHLAGPRRRTRDTRDSTPVHTWTDTRRRLLADTVAVHGDVPGDENLLSLKSDSWR